MFKGILHDYKGATMADAKRPEVSVKGWSRNADYPGIIVGVDGFHGWFVLADSKTAKCDPPNYFTVTDVELFSMHEDMRLTVKTRADTHYLQFKKNQAFITAVNPNESVVPNPAAKEPEKWAGWECGVMPAARGLSLYPNGSVSKYDLTGCWWPIGEGPPAIITVSAVHPGNASVKMAVDYGVAGRIWCNDNTEFVAAFRAAKTAAEKPKPEYKYAVVELLGGVVRGTVQPDGFLSVELDGNRVSVPNRPVGYWHDTPQQAVKAFADKAGAQLKELEKRLQQRIAALNTQAEAFTQ
jgi:hypothetical protein